MIKELLKKEQNLITLIAIDNFRASVLDEIKPVLLAHISRDHEFEDMETVLRHISEKYVNTLKVCLLDEDSNTIFRRFGIEGSPAFIVFHEGKEKGRMLGKVDNNVLDSFVLRTLA